MKRYGFPKRLLLTTLLTLLLAGGGALGTAFANPGGGPGPHHDRDGGRFLQRMAVILNLSADQQDQIEQILTSERQATAPLREALRASRDQLRQLTQAASFDETAVRNLAASQAQTRTELIVAHARARNQIHNLLSPEQQAQAEKLQSLRGGHGRRGPAPESERPEL